jgi:hypothetical protein
VETEPDLGHGRARSLLPSAIFREGGGQSSTGCTRAPRMSRKNTLPHDFVFAMDDREACPLSSRFQEKFCSRPLYSILLPLCASPPQVR